MKLAVVWAFIPIALLCQVGSKLSIGGKVHLSSGNHGGGGGGSVTVTALNTHVALAYTAPSSSPCTVEISQSPTYSPLANDVNGGLFTNASTDSRADGALSSGTARIFVAGRRTVETDLNGYNDSRALQTDTLYYYRVCGSMTGTFTTMSMPAGSYRNDLPLTNAVWWEEPTEDGTRGQQVIDPLTGVLYVRQTLPGDVVGTNHGFIQGFGGLSRPHTNLKFTSGDGKQGYASVYWDDNAGGNMYFFVPSTGEVRHIGHVGGITNPVMRDDKTFLQYRGDLSPTGLYSIPYSGTFMSGDYATGTPVLNQADSTNGACGALAIYDPTHFSTCNTDYTNALVPTYANEYTSYFLQSAGFPHQDAPGVELVFWGGDGRPYDPSCAAGPTACPHVIAAYRIGTLGDPNGCLNHNNQMWSTNLVEMNLKSNDGSCVGGTASIVYWNFLTDPTGSGIISSPWGFGGHDDKKSPGPFSPNGTGGGNPLGPTARLSEASSFCPGGSNGCAYEVVIGNPQSSTISTNPTTAIGAFNAFAGTVGTMAFGLVRHPNWEQDPLQSSANNAASFFDAVPYGGGGYPGGDIVASSVTLVGGKTNTYKFVPTGALNVKQHDTVAKSASTMLVNISGPASVLADTASLGQYCVANVAGECLPGSAAGDIYFNPPNPISQLGCYGSETPNNGVGDICIGDASLHQVNLGQFWGTGGVEASDKSRMIGHGMARSVSWMNGGATFKPLPDTSWATFEKDLFGAFAPSHIWAAKIPSYPAPDGKDRTTFLRAPISVTPPTGMGIATATVEFGYLEYGPQAQHYCTSRREACAVGASSVTDATPFQFEVTDTPVRLSCATSCTPVLPVLPLHTAYWTVKFYDGSGVYVADGQSGVAVENTVLVLGGSSVGFGLSLGTDASAGYFPGLSKFFDWDTATPSGGCTSNSDSRCVGTGLQGDTYFWTAWMPNASQLPVTGGLSIVGTANDAHSVVNCGSSNINILQLDTWDWATPTASHLTKINCMSSYGVGAEHNSPTGWNGALTSGDGESLGTWKSRTPFSKAGCLYLPISRQFSPGGPSVHDATFVMSCDGGQHWCNPYTLFNVGTSPGVCNSSKWQADGDAPKCGAASSAVACTDTGYLDATHSSMMWKGFPYGTENWYWVNPGTQDGATPPAAAPGCDFAAYSCFISYDGSVARVLLSDNLLDISKWQYYTCPTITQSFRCDPSSGANWTSTFASRTGTFYWSWYLGLFQENFTQLFGIQYLSQFGLYVKTGAIQPSPDGFDLLWAPSVVGPWTRFARNDVVSPMWASFFTPSPALGNTVISTNPPHIRLSTSSNSYEATEGTTHMHQWDIVQGTATTFPLLSTGLTWGFTFQDQGPASSLTNWPYFEDTANHATVIVPCDGYPTVGICGSMNSGHGTTMDQYGPIVTDTNQNYFGHYRTFNGEMLTSQVNAPAAMQGNGTFTVVDVFRYDGNPPSSRWGGLWSTGANTSSDGTMVQLMVTDVGSGAGPALYWNGQSNPGYSYFGLTGMTVGNWYMLATTVTAATGSNCPVVGLYLGVGGSVTNSISSCLQQHGASTKTPNVSASPFVLGLSGDGNALPAAHGLVLIYSRALSGADITTPTTGLYDQVKTYMALRGVTVQ